MNEDISGLYKKGFFAQPLYDNFCQLRDKVIYLNLIYQNLQLQLLLYMTLITQ